MTDIKGTIGGDASSPKPDALPGCATPRPFVFNDLRHLRLDAPAYFCLGAYNEANITNAAPLSALASAASM